MVSGLWLVGKPNCCDSPIVIWQSGRVKIDIGEQTNHLFYMLDPQEFVSFTIVFLSAGNHGTWNATQYNRSILFQSWSRLLFLKSFFQGWVRLQSHPAGVVCCCLLPEKCRFSYIPERNGSHELPMWNCINNEECLVLKAHKTLPVIKLLHFLNMKVADMRI